MYSTSSSECQCDEYCTCTYMADACENQGYGRTPFYPTMGQPLIYYAQVPQPPKLQRSRESRKDNKNCFSKAFRWYTQEHLPPRTISPNKTDMSAFAAWLDSKYDEFLRDSQLDSPCHLKAKQTAIIEADRIPNNTCCEPRSKKFRVKSPWRRKRRNSSKEAGDTIQKPTQSFQFILQPKDLARHASECHQPSNSTMISTEIPMKYTIKSQSYTLISQEPADRTTCVEKKPEYDADKSEDISDVKMSQHKASHNISCQCSSVKIVKTNAQSQYEDADAERVTASVNQITLKKTLYCQCCRNNTPDNDAPIAAVLASKKDPAKMPTATLAMIGKCLREPILKADSPMQGQTQNTEHVTSHSNIQSSSKMVKSCPCESDEFKLENLTHFPSPITFSNGGVQTSDHSICLEKDDVHGYPLFMKIVCADKLCKK